jgi:hypothetical protein
MKSLFAALSLSFALIGATVAPVVPARATLALAIPAENAVYVCLSKSSVAYHSSDRCAGLNRCTHEVKAMSASDAQNLGKRACQKCY